MPKATIKPSFLMTIIAAFILASLGILAVYLNQPPKIEVADLVPKNPDIKIESPTIFFSTAVFLNRNKTFVSLPYKLGNPPQTVWLKLQTPAGTPTITRLVYHPVLASLDWPYVEDMGIRLYQKEKQIRSLQEFKLKPPLGAKIMADPALLEQPEFRTIKAQSLPDDPEAIDLNTVDLILTTFKESRVENNQTFYETVIDATPAFVSKENKLNWEIFAPGTSTGRPMFLGNIHVDYRQF